MASGGDGMTEENKNKSTDEEIIELREQINPQNWQMAAGVTVNDSYYALLAYLYEVRKPYSSRNITECLSNDMQCSIAAAK